MLGRIAMVAGAAVNAGHEVRHDDAPKIAAARERAHAVKISGVHAFVAPGGDSRTVALGVHATW